MTQHCGTKASQSYRDVEALGGHEEAEGGADAPPVLGIVPRQQVGRQLAQDLRVRRARGLRLISRLCMQQFSMSEPVSQMHVATKSFSAHPAMLAMLVAFLL